jgi:lauroyl/myristoyl acyltransferase
MRDRDLPRIVRRKLKELTERAVAGAPRVDGYALRRLAYLGSRYGPEPLVRYSPSFWGVLFAAALAEKRRTVRRNLRRVRGPRGRLAEEVDAARTFVRYAHCLAESLGAERAPSRATSPRLVGESNLTNELAGGRGVVLVTAHTGIWDLAARTLAERLGVEVAIVMQQEPDAGARELHDALRARQGVSIVHVAHPLDGVALLRHLRGGGAVAIQMDRVPAGTRAVSVQLFGAPFRVPEGPFLLAATAQVALVPVFARRCGYFDYEISFGPAGRLSRRPGPDELASAARDVVDELARFVRANPNDWFHFEEG